MFRSLLEKLSRDLVIVRKLPAEFGSTKLFVSPDSALSFWKGNLRKSYKELFQWAESFVKPDMKVWDIGANVGLFTFSSAYLCRPNGKVIAIEADTFLLSLLNKTLRSLNEEYSEVVILPTAISNALSIQKFNIARRGRSGNFLDGLTGNQDSGGSRYKTYTLTITLDHLLEYFGAPDLIKIDIEGAEFLALQGAQKILKSIRPKFLIEINNENILAVTEIFNANSYKLYDLQSPNYPLVTTAIFNTLAIPEEKLI